ncbi:hypothetical protein OAN47_03625 [Planctomycetota bacterium]|nr:hypothetical protein [Planctomycetota bacterium]MDC0347486.1 hypothetical protein [Planctomycetota bacterium]|tara:strand:- start:131 stop:757 length:627 start_codon:yes stop_codon:yes gene_type:complete
MKISKTTEKRFSTPRCISYLLFSLLVFSVHNIPVDAQTDFEECGVFEMDPLGQCLLFYPEDASLGALIVDMGATAPPNPGSEGLLIGTQVDCVGICFPTSCVIGANFNPAGCNTTPSPQFIRGDCNNDLTFNLADAIYHLFSLFAAGPPPACYAACDMDIDDASNIGDSIAMLNFLFLNAPPPPDPYPSCGENPNPTQFLDCLNPICP